MSLKLRMRVAAGTIAHTHTEASARIFTMKPEEMIEDGIILDFTVSDEALEHAAADTIFSLGNCTDARVCQVPNEPRVTL